MNINEMISGDIDEQYISEILYRIHSAGPVNQKDFETLAYLKKFHTDLFSRYESKIINLLGLFYKTTRPNNLLEEVYSVYADTIEFDTGRRFTPVQANAYVEINNKRYFSFSAPTSSGKSFLFRELIQDARGDIIIVVPSRALIAEYMHAVLKIVRGDNTILVLQFIENVNISNTKRRIYIITPERGDELFRFIDEFSVELVLFDEAQISEEMIRGMKFDSFVRRIDKRIPNAKKVFAHPFILNPEAQLNKHGFNSDSSYMRYEQNSVGKIYLTVKDGNFYHFSPFVYSVTKEVVEVNNDIVLEVLKNKGTLLIYTSKSKLYDGSYIHEFAKYIELCPKLVNPEAIELIDELREFIGASDAQGDKHSFMIDMMEKGIVIHHGSMPLRARLIIETFVNRNHANICFATSTLIQGINMPFDVVWIHNFRFQGSENQKNLNLKNLIGRAGRSTINSNSFDYGYVIVDKTNVTSFCNRMSNTTSLSDTSHLDDNILDIPEDLMDIAEAIKYDSFDVELQLTNSQVERLQKTDNIQYIEYILDTFLHNNKPITGKEYYDLSDYERNGVKEAFKKIYVSHLRKKQLSKGESSVLSISIPILLWIIQGKSFKEIISLRHAFLTHKDIQRNIMSRLRRKEITPKEAAVEINSIEIRYTTVANTLPDSRATTASLFPRGTSIKTFDYDVLVYDTYDYIDKVISLSLSDPLSAAFQMYYNETNDERASIMKNYIKYGTNDEIEIWLLRYGFGFDEIEWIREYVESIDENQIYFSKKISELSPNRYEMIERYI